MNGVTGRYNFAEQWLAKRLLLVFSIALGILILFMAWSTPVAAAITMRLVQTQGVVDLKNQSNELLNIEPGMRLFSGDSLATEESSYAFISLDDAKSIKLDALSECTLEENGEHLQVDLTSGKLFFEVTEPLGEEELFNIRTSNAVTSIRGTSGYVENLSDTLSRFTLLTGHADVSFLDLATGDEQVTSLNAGESVLIDTAADGAESTFEVMPLALGNIPDFVLSHVSGNGSLLAEIETQSALRLADADDDDDDDDNGDDDDDNDDDDANDDITGDTDDDDDDDMRPANGGNSGNVGGSGNHSDNDDDDRDENERTDRTENEDPGDGINPGDVAPANSPPHSPNATPQDPTPQAPAPQEPTATPPVVVPEQDDDDDGGDDGGGDGGGDGGDDGGGDDDDGD